LTICFDLLALAANDHVDVRTSLEQFLDLQGGLVAPDDDRDLVGQLGDEVANPVELRMPADADAHEIDVLADERAERGRVLVDLLVAKVELGHLADQVFHAGDDVLQAGGREQTHDRRRMSEVRVQCEDVFVLGHNWESPFNLINRTFALQSCLSVPRWFLASVHHRGERKPPRFPIG